MKNLFYLLLVIVIFIAGAIVGFYLQVNPAWPQDRGAASEVDGPETIVVSLMIDYGNGLVVTYDDQALEPEASVLDLLNKLNQEQGLELSYNPPQGNFGAFVTSIGGTANDNDNGKWWGYWVNNQYAQLAADQYRLRAGDVVEWQYGAEMEF